MPHFSRALEANCRRRILKKYCHQKCFDMERFTVHEHTFDAHHPRQSTRATSDGFKRLKIAVKEYRSTDVGLNEPTGISVVFCQANGIPKESYEPFFDDLYDQLKGTPAQIKTIWSIDNVTHGDSYVLNEHSIGTDYFWRDGARDVIAFMQQAKIKEPVMAIGHSFGAASLLFANSISPHLFMTVVAYEPIVSDPSVSLAHEALGSHIMASMSSTRRDIFDSPASFKKYLSSRPFWAAWDPRVLEKYVTYGLRDVPTKLHADKKSGVVLKTPREQEVFVFSQIEDYENISYLSRKELFEIFDVYKYCQDPVFFIWAEVSPTKEEVQKNVVKRIKNSQATTILEASHMNLAEKPTECAKVGAKYIISAVDKYNKFTSWRSTFSLDGSFTKEWKDRFALKPRL